MGVFVLFLLLVALAGGYVLGNKFPNSFVQNLFKKSVKSPNVIHTTHGNMTLTTSTPVTGSAPTVSSNTTLKV